MLGLLKEYKLTLAALVVLCSMILMVGCQGRSSQERIENLNVAVDKYVEDREAQTLAIESLEDTVAGLKVALDEANTTGDDALIAKATAALSKMQSALAEAKEVKVKLDLVIDETNANIDKLLAGEDEITWSDEVAVYLPAAQAASSYLPPPWNLIVNGVLVGVGGIIETKRRTTKKDRDNNANALVEVVTGVAAVLKDDAVNSEVVKKKLSDNQTNATEALVKDIKAKLPTG